MAAKGGKLRVGVLGVGRIGKIHAENLVARIPDAQLAILADVFSDGLKATAAKLGVSKTVTDYRDVINLPEVDAVVICTPTNTHHQIILDAAAAGKHIFCEKPIELSIKKIKTINETVEKCGVQLMVGFNRRFDPNFSKVREMVEKGRIGQAQILRITSRDPAPPSESYLRASGGIFLDMTIHDFDMARYVMLAEVKEVYAKACVLVDPLFKKVRDWDTAVTTLTFENGALGTIDNSRQAVYGYDQRVEVFGSEGMITVKNKSPDDHVHIDRSGAHSSLPLRFFLERYAESYLNEMRAFVDAVRKDKPVPVTGKDGLMSVAIALAATKSAKENRPTSVAGIL
jgi:myo-inositol 2-dehydrogenase / D-chiro-inositol 1-dehydrogenase